MNGGPDHIVLVQAYFTYAESTGFTWTVMPPLTGADTTALWAFSASDVIAIDSNGSRKFDGTTWLPRQSIDTGGRSLYAMWGSSTGALYAVGYDGVIAEYGGGTWVDRSVTTTADLHAVWGEADDRVFAVGSDGISSAVIYEYDGIAWTEVFRDNASFALGAVWGSAATGSYALSTGVPMMLHLPPGAPTDQWTPIPLPRINPKGVWGDANGVMVTFGDGQAYRYANDAWTLLSTRPYGAARGLVGSASDLFGIAGYALVRWDGQTWDRIRLPAAMLEATAVYSGNGVVAVSGRIMNGHSITLLVRPK
jgi:hypothetical protein